MAEAVVLDSNILKLAYSWRDREGNPVARVVEA